MKFLDEREFKATFSERMEQVDTDQAPAFDFWPYFGSIPSEDFGPYDCSEGEVHNVWRDSSNRFVHVLVNSKNQNVFMVLVLDCHTNAVLGHRLLNLNIEYGLAP